jgi:hypothetical protein
MIRESREGAVVRSIIREMLLPKYATTTLSLQIEGFPLGGDWVRDTLGYRIPLNEGPIDEALIRRIVREGLDLAGWLDKTKDLIGMGIDAVKKKASDAAEAIDEFGENIRGASVAIWLAAKNGTMGELATKAIDGFYEFGEALKGYFTRAKNLLKKIWEDLKGGSVSESDKPDASAVANDPSSYFEKAEEIVQKVIDFVTSHKGGIVGVLSAVAAALGLRWWWEEEHFKKVKTFLTGLKALYTKGGAKAVKAALGAGVAGGIAWLASDAVKTFISDMLKKFATNAVVTTFAAPAKMFAEMVAYVSSAAWALDTISRIITGKTPEINDLKDEPAA